MSRAAEDDSEVDDEKQRVENTVQPRDSGCFESSENLEGRREEPKTEGGLEESEEQREEDKQVEDVQQQLQQLTVEEES